MPTVEEYRKMMEDWYREQQAAEEPEPEPEPTYSWEYQYKIPTPQVAPAPTPQITSIEYAQQIPRVQPQTTSYDFYQYMLPRLPGPATPRSYAPPPGERIPYEYLGPGERGEYRPFPRLPFEAFAPLQPMDVSQLPVAPWVSDIYGTTWATKTPPRTIEEARRWSFDWRGMLENYKRIFKKYYEGPTFDFAISGPSEELYSPEEYIPTYEYAEAPPITITYGGGGTPSGQRNYAANLINWRV